MLYPERALATPYLATPYSAFSLTVTRVACLAFGGVLTGALFERAPPDISRYFHAVQDTPVLLLFVVFFVAVNLIAKRNAPLPALGPVWRGSDFRFAGVIAIVVCFAVYAGSHLVYHHFALSLDEFMAEFDARIIARAKLLASVAPEWRDYVPALQPTFRLSVPENAYWISSYLPMNAALRAVFVGLGDPAWEGAILAGVAVVALFGVARRLWPERPDAAGVSVVLLVCSSQFLVMAMTPYAMTAHLAFNMLWLWLFLRDTRGSHLMAAGVAFVACGLHQVMFHPLFAAPFMISLLTRRRWKLAAYYSTVYAAIGLFWVLYWRIVLAQANAPIGQSADVGLLNFIDRILDMADLSAANIGTMCVNLYRFVAWQCPIAIPLAVVGLLGCRTRNETVFNLALGIAFTLAAVLVLMPFQGHGWGYRYLHGFLGSVSLIAAHGWTRITNRDAEMTKAPAFALAASAALSLVVLLPWRAIQVHSFVEPYAAASAAIERSNADVVVVDPTNIWYGEDLVRNDPFLQNLPKVLVLDFLDEALLRRLCQHHDVAIFDREDAPRFGLLNVESPSGQVGRNQRLRRAMSSWGCGRPALGGRS
jgi:hypothetical protein